MSCYVVSMDNGGFMFLCGDLGPHCADCEDVAINLCDYPVGDGKTCDRPICDLHSHEIAPNLHYCDAHNSEWERFRARGGVDRELVNVVPFKKPSRMYS
jgi:hypothetical protein